MNVLLLSVSLSLFSQVLTATQKCTIGGDIFQTEISFDRSSTTGQITEIKVQNLIRGAASGEAKVMPVEIINNYRKGWTYRVHIEDNFYGIVDDSAGKGSLYVNLIFGQGSIGICNPRHTPNN